MKQTYFASQSPSRRIPRAFERASTPSKSLHTRKAQEMAVEFVHNCNLFADGIGDFLYWVQGKKPPGGFKNGVTTAYFEKLLNR